MSENAVPIRLGNIMSKMPAPGRTVVVWQVHTEPVPE